NLMIAKSHTREGEEVQFGDNPSLMPGPENTYQSYGTAWANLSNSPFRLYKHWVHEGGIATPLIVQWPKGLKKKGELRHTPGQLTDIMATIVDVTGANYPENYDGKPILSMEGKSLKEDFEDKHNDNDNAPLYFEHEGNAAVRLGKWKLVRSYPDDWELFNMEKDRTEMNDLAKEHPEKVVEMSEMYEKWATRCQVVAREKILELMKNTKKACWENN